LKERFSGEVDILLENGIESEGDWDGLEPACDLDERELQGELPEGNDLIFKSVHLHIAPSVS
jgi:hypothetical protein